MKNFYRAEAKVNLSDNQREADWQVLDPRIMGHLAFPSTVLAGKTTALVTALYSPWNIPAMGPVLQSVFSTSVSEARAIAFVLSWGTGGLFRKKPSALLPTYKTTTTKTGLELSNQTVT